MPLPISRSLAPDQGVTRVAFTPLRHAPHGQSTTCGAPKRWLPDLWAMPWLEQCMEPRRGPGGAKQRPKVCSGKSSTDWASTSRPTCTMAPQNPRSGAVWCPHAGSSRRHLENQRFFIYLQCLMRECAKFPWAAVGWPQDLRVALPRLQCQDRHSLLTIRTSGITYVCYIRPRRSVSAWAWRFRRIVFGSGSTSV